MKKLILLCLAVILLSCSSDQSENSPASNNPNPSNPNESELSKYIISECSDFVKFHPTDPTFLNYLISKGYDLNNDLKISCDEASKVIDLDLGNTGYVKILNGIEYLKNLKSITGYVDLGGYYPNSTTENTLNLYNNSNLEEVYLTPHKNIGNGYIPIIVLPKDSRLKKLDCSKSSMDRILNLSAQPNLKFLDLKFSVSALWTC